MGLFAKPRAKKLSAAGLAVAGVAIGTAAAGGGALAQDTQHPTPALDKLHLGVAVGPIFPEDVSASLSGTITGSGKLNFNAAGAVSGFVGYDVTEHLAAEAEIGWTL